MHGKITLNNASASGAIAVDTIWLPTGLATIQDKLRNPDESRNFRHTSSSMMFEFPPRIPTVWFYAVLDEWANNGWSLVARLTA